MGTRRLTTAQALIRFLSNQYVERDGREQPFFGGCFGIFGHGNVAGVGQALHQYSGDFTYYQTRNEQAMVHTAAGYARMNNRLRTFACTSSIGPGATNMVTGAALATVNRLPVLLLPGDVFANRIPDPVLQQLKDPGDGTVSVNDSFRAVSKYWDRITRPEQIVPAAQAAMRVLTNQAETGAVTLAFPQDVQAEAYDFPERFLEKRIWHIDRPLPDASAIDRAVREIEAASNPMIVSGGGVIYSEATGALEDFVDATGIPVGLTQAGKGSLPHDHPRCLGAVGATGTSAANPIARDADVVIGVGTRWTDFTTASKSAFQNPEVTFVNINIADFDAVKHGGVSLVGDARETLKALREKLTGYEVDSTFTTRISEGVEEWDEEVDRLYNLEHGRPPSQAEVIGAVNQAAQPTDVMVCASGSMPGDLHKLWRTKTPKAYHVEYGYSCMGYEIAGGLGVKMADPDREVFVMVGDGSYLMLNSEIVTSIQEGMKLILVLVDNRGFASIGGLSRSIGSEGFGTLYRYRHEGSLGTDEEEDLDEHILPVDLAGNAESLGAKVFRTDTIEDFREALVKAREAERTSVVQVLTDRYHSVPEYDSWWDVPVAEVSELEEVQQSRREYERNKSSQRWYL